MLTARRLSFLLLVGILLGLMVVFVRAAEAHDWYPPNCCSGHDCFPIEIEDETSALTPIQGGYIVNASRTAVTGTQIRQSQDGRFHLCTKTGLIDGPPVCLFEPPKSF